MFHGPENCSFPSIFEVAKMVMSGSVFCQLVFGVLFISTTYFELEVVNIFVYDNLLFIKID